MKELKVISLFSGYGTQELGPDTRHPDYAGDYTSSGTGIYHSNWLMSLMVGDYGDFGPAVGIRPETDPRRRFYFYRQNWVTPGNYGLIIITALVICRFFDTDLSFVLRGLLFISVGEFKKDFFIVLLIVTETIIFSLKRKLVIYLFVIYFLLDSLTFSLFNSDHFFLEILRDSFVN